MGQNGKTMGQNDKTMGQNGRMSWNNDRTMGKTYRPIDLARENVISDQVA